MIGELWEQEAGSPRAEACPRRPYPRSRAAEPRCRYGSTFNPKGTHDDRGSGG